MMRLPLQHPTQPYARAALDISGFASPTDQLMAPGGPWTLFPASVATEVIQHPLPHGRWYPGVSL